MSTRSIMPRQTTPHCPHCQAPQPVTPAPPSAVTEDHHITIHARQTVIQNGAHGHSRQSSTHTPSPTLQAPCSPPDAPTQQLIIILTQQQTRHLICWIALIASLHLIVLITLYRLSRTTEPRPIPGYITP